MSRCNRKFLMLPLEKLLYNKFTHTIQTKTITYIKKLLLLHKLNKETSKKQSKSALFSLLCPLKTLVKETETHPSNMAAKTNKKTFTGTNESKIFPSF